MLLRIHIRAFVEMLEGSVVLGRPPDDLLDVLADLTIAGPAVVALRSLGRAAPSLPYDSPAMLSAAARVAGAFRSMYNLPESIALLRAPDDQPYWRMLLRYGAEHDLQSVMDEYTHMLKESLGLSGRSDAEAVAQIAAEIADALSLRTANVAADEIQAGSSIVRFRTFRFRCRYAVRYGELRDDQGGTLARLDVVRKAFNSPFRPFVLATTSIGQEGLDFHTYCHAVYHWNLPSNPVDLEQREGRVHRYKGHAVRKNVAAKYGVGALPADAPPRIEPWTELFDVAGREREGTTELIPYWMYPLEGGAAVERRVPLLPLSREHGKLRQLQRSLALYRLVFGQPRQEELLTVLAERAERAGDWERWRIDLRPGG